MKLVTYLGSLVQLCCREGGALQTNTTGVCGERSQCLSHTGLAPTHGMCALLVYTAQAPGCSAGELSNAGSGLRALPRSQLLKFRYSTRAQTRLGLCFVPCPGPSSSEEQVLSERTLPGGWCVLTPHRSQPLSFLSVQLDRCLRCAMCLLLGAYLCNSPGRCQPSRIPGRLG